MSRQSAIEYAKRFKWGFDNACGGSDDWRCDMQRDYDEFGDEIDHGRDPCTCPECEGASVRLHCWNGRLSLSTRITLNLATANEGSAAA